jgi:protein gp37
MSATKIDWADAVWNPLTGCSKVSPACDHCWAERMSKRLAGRCGYPAADPFAVAFHPDRLEEPLRWRKPRRVFVCSMGDLFHEDVTDDQLLAVFTTMAQPQARHHTFLILTKRPDRMREWFDDARRAGLTLREGHGAVLPNVWLGVTAENQAMADERIPALLDTPAARHFVSWSPNWGPWR